MLYTAVSADLAAQQAASLNSAVLQTKSTQPLSQALTQASMEKSKPMVEISWLAFYLLHLLLETMCSPRRLISN